METKETTDTNSDSAKTVKSDSTSVLKKKKSTGKWCSVAQTPEHTFGDWQEVRLEMMTDTGIPSGFIWYERRCLLCGKNFFRTE